MQHKVISTSAVSAARHHFMDELSYNSTINYATGDKRYNLVGCCNIRTQRAIASDTLFSHSRLREQYAPLFSLEKKSSYPWFFFTVIFSEGELFINTSNNIHGVAPFKYNQKLEHIFSKTFLPFFKNLAVIQQDANGEMVSKKLDFDDLDIDLL